MNTYILYNPHAGHGSIAEKATELAQKYDNVTLFDMTEIADYAALLSPLGATDRVIVCGGDGTLNRFVNDTDGIELTCEIYYYAVGTGNDFLHDLGLQPGADPILVNKYLKDLPVTYVNGKKFRFFNNVGYGIDGYCCEVGDKLKVTSTKPVNYTAIAIKGLLFHYKPCGATVTVDGKEYRYKKVWLAPTMKGRFYGGGMMAAPEQDRNNPDKTLSVMLLFNSGRIRTLLAFPSIFKGTLGEHKKIVATHTGHTIHVKFDAPSTVQIDGETILDVTEYTAYARVPVNA